MLVTKEKFEDAGERDANGYYDFYYSGFIFRFEFSNRVLIARRYDDTPKEASFLSPESIPDRVRTSYSAIPYHDPEFREAVQYLRTSEGVEFVKVLVPTGYVDVNFAAFKC